MPIAVLTSCNYGLFGSFFPFYFCFIFVYFSLGVSGPVIDFFFYLGWYIWRGVWLHYSKRLLIISYLQSGQYDAMIVHPRLER